MNYGIIEISSLKANECLVIGLHSDCSIPDFVNSIDEEQKGLLSRLQEKLTTAGDFVWQRELTAFHSLVVLHCGTQNEFNGKNLIKFFEPIIEELLKQRIVSATICLPAIKDYDANWQLSQMIRLIEAKIYRLTQFKTTKQPLLALTEIQFYLPNATNKAIEKAKAIASGVKLARVLADLPSNLCTPTYIGEQALELAKKHTSLRCKIIDRDKMQALGMGIFLAVAKGSKEPPCLVELQYNGGGDSAPVVLVGKGITFDSGGLSLKLGEAMVDMKYDMAGAASVLGTLAACCELKLPINVIGLLACAENMPGGTATKPGDIVTSMSGQNIEILNTDAEGRLVLADSLTYAERFNPALVIDIATLTGAVIVALGSLHTGLLTNDDDLATALFSAAKESADTVWRLPLDEEYEAALKSPLADMINAAFDRSAGSITAACFLSRFTKRYRWAHLDIAGTAWIMGKARCATGRPVGLLTQFLCNFANTINES